MKNATVFCLFFVTIVFAFNSIRGDTTAEKQASKPNIVLIISDDQHWGDYGFMKHPVLHTPRLDRLASEGLTYTRGYVPSSLCCPSLASIITGQYPHQHRITSNDPPLPEGMKKPAFYQSASYREGRDTMIEQMKKAPTLPKLLEQEGYISLQTGKWWLGDYRSGGFTDGMTQGSRHGDRGLQIGRDTMKPISDFLDRAEKENKPFFIWYAPLLPHDPHNPPERFLNKYKDKTDSPHQANYWGNVEWFDETCGQLLDELDERKLSDNTVVLYVCDNGWIQNQKNRSFNARSKQSQYDGGLRTPIMIRWPGHVKPEMNSGDFVSSIDIAPTLLKIAGHEKVASQPGIDLLDRKAVHERKAVYGECFTHDFVDLLHPEKNLRYRWMIEDGWKLIVAQPGEKTEVELYNVLEDPSEENNLAETQADRVKAMMKKLEAFYDPAHPEKAANPAD